MIYQIRTYYEKEKLPQFESDKFFHSAMFFDWNKNIKDYKPLIFIVFANEKPVTVMSALIMRINRFLRGSIFKRCYISQQPIFLDNKIDKVEVFNLLMKSLIKEVGRKAYFIEYHNIGNTNFGYKGFRENKFFSIKWIRILNSLQRKNSTVWEQLSPTRKNQINKAKRKSLNFEEVSTKNMLSEIYNVIEKSKKWKLSYPFPPFKYFDNFFHCYVEQQKGKIYVSRYNNQIIGGIILGFENETVYCLYYWGKDKSYKMLHPSAFTIYSAMEMAERAGFKYFDFMDSGYLNEKAGKPRFLLQFGGEPKATRRWYRFNWSLLNFFAKRIYD